MRRLRELYAPKAKKEKDWVDVHKVDKKDLPPGEKTDFTGEPVKVIDRKGKKLGADAGKDTSGEVCEDYDKKAEKEAHDYIHKMAKAQRKFFKKKTKEMNEEWIIVDKHKNAIISKHGEDQRGALIGARKMDFTEWNKTKKLGRFVPMATHGPGTAPPNTGNLEPGKAKPKPKTKPAAKKPTPKKPTTTKAKTNTPGQKDSGGGTFATHIAGFISKAMKKMFTEAAYSSYDMKNNTYKGYDSISDFQKAWRAKHFDQNKVDAYNNNKAANKLNPNYQNTGENAPKNDQEVKNELGTKKSKDVPWEKRHPLINHLKNRAIDAMKADIFSESVEEQPNYHVHVLLSNGGIGDKSFRRYSISTINPRYSGAPNESLPEGFISSVLLKDPKFHELKENGFNNIEKIIGSDDGHKAEHEMNEFHAHLIRVNDTIRRKFTHKDEE